MKAHGIAGHQVSNLFLRIVDQQALDRQHALENAFIVDHEQFVGMTRQLFQPAQVTQDHFQADVFADGDHLEVHQCADLILVIGQRGAHALTLLAVKGLHQLMDNITRQLWSQVGQFVSVHLPGGRQELVIVHVGDQGFTDRVGYFEQDIAVAVGLDQLPEGQSIIQGQGFENVGNVGGVQVVELALQLDEVLAVDQVFDEVVIRTILAVREIFDHALALQQLDDLSQAILQAFLCFLYFYFGHRRTPLPAAGHAGRINQSIHDW
ncbi:AraC family transcriptional regulator [Pseudomonas marginalis]